MLEPVGRGMEMWRGHEKIGDENRDSQWRFLSCCDVTPDSGLVLGKAVKLTKVVFPPLFLSESTSPRQLFPCHMLPRCPQGEQICTLGSALDLELEGLDSRSDPASHQQWCDLRHVSLTSEILSFPC